MVQEKKLTKREGSDGEDEEQKGHKRYRKQIVKGKTKPLWMVTLCKYAKFSNGTVEMGKMDRKITISLYAV